jgi:hypothetical protein
MAAPKRLELSVTGVLNGVALSGGGTLWIGAAGIKSGTILFDSLPSSWRGGPMSIVILTGRGHIGAVSMEPDLAGLLAGLLGNAFESFRLTTFAHYGILSVSERARVTGSTVRSEMVTVGELKLPRIVAMGPLQEKIQVSGDGTLVSEGRYSLKRAGGRSIPVRYTHFYHSLKPNRRLFRRLRGTVFLLRVKFAHRARGAKLSYHSQGTLRRGKLGR